MSEPTASNKDKKRCFVISPMGEEGSEERKRADLVLRYVIRRPLVDEYRVSRADDDTNPGAITPRVIQSILEADLIVADITSGNANVFYELAIAHGYDKPTIHVMASGTKPPFDVKDLRVIDYDLTNPERLEKAQETIARYAEFARSRPEEIETPLKGAQRFEAVQQSDDPLAKTTVQILKAVEALGLEVRLLRGRIAMSELLKASPEDDLNRALRGGGTAVIPKGVDDVYRTGAGTGSIDVAALRAVIQEGGPDSSTEI
jgi:hypothetical protein